MYLLANSCELPHMTAVTIPCCTFEVQKETQRIADGMSIIKLQKLLNVLAILICT
jgi:hypothetical protein